MSALFQNKRVALIGCGDIGNRVASLLKSEGAEVTGFRRNPDKVFAGIEAVALDVTDRHSVQLLAEQSFDYVVISLTPGVSAKVKDQQAVAEAYKATYVQGLANILAALNLNVVKKIIWVSSTSVYSQDDGQWIDETDETLPQRTSGQCLLEAEQLLEPLNNKALIIRFAGIYREGRHRLITQLQAGKLAATVDKDYYSNRIHVQDCARMITYLIDKDIEGTLLNSLYIGCDNTPVLYSELVAFLAQKSGLPLNTEVQAKKPAVGSKRCSNALIKELGFEFLYPDYERGFSHLLI